MLTASIALEVADSIEELIFVGCHSGSLLDGPPRCSYLSGGTLVDYCCLDRFVRQYRRPQRFLVQRGWVRVLAEEGAVVVATSALPYLEQRNPSTEPSVRCAIVVGLLPTVVRLDPVRVGPRSKQGRNSWK